LLGRRSLLILISTVLSTVLSFISIYFIIKHIGAETYGTFVVALAIVSTFNSISDLGFSSAHIKRISEGKDINECISTFLVTRLALIGAMILVLAISLIVWTSFLEGDLSGDKVWLFLLIVIYIIFVDVSNVVITTFNAKTQTAKAQLLSLCSPFLLVPMIVFMCLYSPSMINLALVYTITGFTIALIALFMLFRENVIFTKPVLFRSYAVFALPLAITTILGMVAMNVDKIVIGWFDVSDAAYYSTSQTLVAVFGIIGASVATLTFPAFSRMHAENDLRSIRKITLSAERYICMLGLPITLLIVLFPTEIIKVLFGPTWSPAGAPLRFLAMAMMFDLMNSVYNSQILAVNRPDISAKLNIIYVTTLILSLFILVPPSIAGIALAGLSATGAALGLMIASGVHLVLVRIVVRKLTGTASNRRILIQFVSVAMVGAILLSLAGEYPIQDWPSLIAYGILTLVLFGGCLVLLRELKREDIFYFLDVVNPMKMGSYISEELKSEERGKHQ